MHKYLLKEADFNSQVKLSLCINFPVSLFKVFMYVEKEKK